MSFLTEYFDEYRQHPIKKQKPCAPDDRFAKLEGKWLDPKTGKHEKEKTDEEIKAFIKETMKSLRGQSAYYNSYCAHLDPAFKTRAFVPRPKKKRPCKPQPKTVTSTVAIPTSTATLALKDTEVMKMAGALYGYDLDTPTLKPLNTSSRILGYVRPHLYHTGISDYQGSIARLAYELVRDDRIPRYVASNGNRPQWGYPPEKPRQPELDGIPLDGESLF